MSKSRKKILVVVAGLIAIFLLTRFLKINHPVGAWFSGYFLSYIVIAVLALLYGPVAGGALGALAAITFILVSLLTKTSLLTELLLLTEDFAGSYPISIRMYISMVLFLGLYGSIFGGLFEYKKIKANSKNAVLDIGLFSLLAFGLFLVFQMIFLLFAYFYSWSPRIGAVYFIIANQGPLIQWLIRGLIIGVISFVVTLFCLKSLKINIPVYFKEKRPRRRAIPRPVRSSTLPESQFDGGLLSLLGWCILGFFLTVFTLGVCYPWALCMVYGWKINHTVINGRRLKFSGSPVNLFGHWILWLLLCIITAGIYSFWLYIALEKWKVKNTDFA
jgi:hypothetical protein